MKKPILKVLPALLVFPVISALLSCDCLSSSKTSATSLPGTAPASAGYQSWNFAVSGDSRNCGDVVMPAIAAGAARDHAAFYWHLGDLRWITKPDEDMQQIATLKGKPFINFDDYRKLAWDDFIDNQIMAFGNIPFYVGIGNHETILPKTRQEFVLKFAKWLEQGENNGIPTSQTYYHWKKGAVDFIYLDNASDDQFDAAQMTWFESVVKNDAGDSSVRAVVVGMHKALPYSISCDHSMNESAAGIKSGTQVYLDLLDLQNKSQKNVYVLASHSHFYMEGIFNTNYWRQNGGVLRGWIVGTAGAQRYRLPLNKDDAKTSATDVYGYMRGTVHNDGTIDFQFRLLDDDHIPDEIKSRYTEKFGWETCFCGNRRPDRPPLPDSCAPVAKPVGVQDDMGKP
jgi:hypothetical protein